MRSAWALLLFVVQALSLPHNYHDGPNQLQTLTFALDDLDLEGLSNVEKFDRILRCSEYFTMMFQNAKRNNNNYNYNYYSPPVQPKTGKSKITGVDSFESTNQIIMSKEQDNAECELIWTSYQNLMGGDIYNEINNADDLANWLTVLLSDDNGKQKTYKVMPANYYGWNTIDSDAEEALTNNMKSMKKVLKGAAKNTGKRSAGAKDATLKRRRRGEGPKGKPESMDEISSMLMKMISSTQTMGSMVGGPLIDMSDSKEKRDISSILRRVARTGKGEGEKKEDPKEKEQKGKKPGGGKSLDMGDLWQWLQTMMDFSTNNMSGTNIGKRSLSDLKDSGNKRLRKRGIKLLGNVNNILNALVFSAGLNVNNVYNILGTYNLADAIKAILEKDYGYRIDPEKVAKITGTKYSPLDIGLLTNFEFVPAAYIVDFILNLFGIPSAVDVLKEKLGYPIDHGEELTEGNKSLGELLLSLGYLVDFIQTDFLGAEYGIIEALGDAIKLEYELKKGKYKENNEDSRDNNEEQPEYQVWSADEMLHNKKRSANYFDLGKVVNPILGVTSSLIDVLFETLNFEGPVNVYRKLTAKDGEGNLQGNSTEQHAGRNKQSFIQTINNILNALLFEVGLDINQVFNILHMHNLVDEITKAAEIIYGTKIDPEKVAKLTGEKYPPLDLGLLMNLQLIPLGYVLDQLLTNIDVSGFDVLKEKLGFPIINEDAVQEPNREIGEFLGGVAYVVDFIERRLLHSKYGAIDDLVDAFQLELGAETSFTKDDGLFDENQEGSKDNSDQEKSNTDEDQNEKEDENKTEDEDEVENDDENEDEDEDEDFFIRKRSPDFRSIEKPTSHKIWNTKKRRPRHFDLGKLVNPILGVTTSLIDVIFESLNLEGPVNVYRKLTAKDDGGENDRSKNQHSGGNKGSLIQTINDFINALLFLVGLDVNHVFNILGMHNLADEITKAAELFYEAKIDPEKVAKLTGANYPPLDLGLLTNLQLVPIAYGLDRLESNIDLGSVYVYQQLLGYPVDNENAVKEPNRRYGEFILGLSAIVQYIQKNLLGSKYGYLDALADAIELEYGATTFFTKDDDLFDDNNTGSEPNSDDKISNGDEGNNNNNDNDHDNDSDDYVGSNEIDDDGVDDNDRKKRSLDFLGIGKSTAPLFADLFFIVNDLFKELGLQGPVELYGKLTSYDEVSENLLEKEEKEKVFNWIYGNSTESKREADEEIRN